MVFFIFYKLYTIVVAIVVFNVHTAKIKDRTRCREFPCLIFHDDFNNLDHSVWDHLITTTPTGNGEFQYYTNNRTNSFIKEGVLYLKPTLTNDTFSDDFLTSGRYYIYKLWVVVQLQICVSPNLGCFKCTNIRESQEVTQVA